MDDWTDDELIDAMARGELLGSTNDRACAIARRLNAIEKPGLEVRALRRERDSLVRLVGQLEMRLAKIKRAAQAVVNADQ